MTEHKKQGFDEKQTLGFVDEKIRNNDGYCYHNYESDPVSHLGGSWADLPAKYKDQIPKKMHNVLADLSEKNLSECIDREYDFYKDSSHTLGKISGKTQAIVSKYLQMIVGPVPPSLTHYSYCDCCLITTSSLNRIRGLLIDNETTKAFWRPLGQLFDSKSVSTHATNYMRIHSSYEFKDTDGSDMNDTKRQRKRLEAIERNTKEIQDFMQQDHKESWSSRWLALKEYIAAFGDKNYGFVIHHPTIDLWNPPENLLELTQLYIEYRSLWLASNPPRGNHCLWANAMRWAVETNKISRDKIPLGFFYTFACKDGHDNARAWHCGVCDKPVVNTDMSKEKVDKGVAKMEIEDNVEF
jgi:hypothetical protein